MQGTKFEDEAEGDGWFVGIGWNEKGLKRDRFGAFGERKVFFSSMCLCKNKVNIKLSQNE